MKGIQSMWMARRSLHKKKTKMWLPQQPNTFGVEARNRISFGSLFLSVRLLLPEPITPADRPVRILHVRCLLGWRKKTQSREGLYYSYRNRLSDCSCTHLLIECVCGRVQSWTCFRAIW